MTDKTSYNKIHLECEHPKESRITLFMRNLMTVSEKCSKCGKVWGWLNWSWN